MTRYSMRLAAWRALLLAAILSIAAPGGTFAQSAETQSGEEIWNQIAALPWVDGPQKVSAVEGASLSVPVNYVFLDVASTPKFMNLTQNPRSGEEREQLLAPSDLHWFGILEFSADGYVEDNEEIDADALLESLKKGTEASNAVRRENGWAEMKITGWRRPPYYDAATNRLEWAIDADNTDGTSSTNFNTRILGRHGVTSAVLVTDPQNFEKDLVEFKQALAGYEFNEGERYSEFKQGDKVAAYGLGALVLGGAAAVAAKSGFLKFIGKFLWIGIVAVLAAAGGILKKLFGGRKAT
jgi:uncharacterized membrane-anchored protein